MTAQTFEGFLLTRNWRDTPAGVELEFWFSTHDGPLCATVREERAVFFLPLEAREQAAQLLRQEPGLEIKPVNLRTFAMAPVIALYFPQYRRRDVPQMHCASRAWTRWRQTSTRPIAF